MKGECNVARDLMPLCIDGAASKESEEYVNGHVAECAPCRACYEEMKGGLPRRLVRQAAAEGDAFARAAARMRRRRVPGSIRAVPTVIWRCSCWRCPSVFPGRSLRSWYSVPPKATFKSCSPRQIPRTARRCSLA